MIIVYLSLAMGIVYLAIYGVPNGLLYALIPPVYHNEDKPIFPIAFKERAQTEEKNEKDEELPPSLPYEEKRLNQRRHILDSYASVLQGKVNTALCDVMDCEDKIVTVAGEILTLREQTTTKGTIANFVLRDPSGNAEGLIFPMTYMAHPVEEHQIVHLVCKVSNSKLLVNGVEVLGKKRVRAKTARKEGTCPAPQLEERPMIKESSPVIIKKRK